MSRTLSIAVLLAACAEALQVQMNETQPPQNHPGYKGPHMWLPLPPSRDVTDVAVIGSTMSRGEFWKRTVPRARGSPWPEFLHEFLLHKYQVGNFGVDQVVMTSSGSKPYSRFNAFSNAIKWQPKIVLIQAGGQDDIDEWGTIWQDWEQEITNMVSQLKEGIPKVKVFLLIPPPWYQQADPSKAAISNTVIMQTMFRIADKFPKSETTGPAVETINLNRLFRIHCPHDGNGYFTLPHEPHCDWMLADDRMPSKQGQIHIAMEIRDRIWEWMDTTPGRKKDLKAMRKGLAREEQP